MEALASDVVEAVNREAVDALMADADDQTVETTLFESVLGEQEKDTALTSTETFMEAR